MSIDRPSLPVTTIGGYLGAGKTTLVNHLLRNASGRRLAILVNEFGALPIDEDLIEAREGDLISLAGGCICCSFGTDLTAALMDMSRLDPPPDHIVIESSGVALPGAIVATLSLLPDVHSDGIVVVVDAETIRRHGSDRYIGDTIMRQLSDAELLVVNKLDLVSLDEQKELLHWLREQAPNAVPIPSEHGRVDPDALLGRIDKPGEGFSQSGHADALFESVVIETSEATDPSELARLLATGGFGVVRAKGFISDRKGGKHLIQTVGRRWNTARAEKTAETGIVCIGFRDDLKKEELVSTLVKLRSN